MHGPGGIVGRPGETLQVRRSGAGRPVGAGAQRPPPGLFRERSRRRARGGGGCRGGGTGEVEGPGEGARPSPGAPLRQPRASPEPLCNGHGGTVPVEPLRGLPPSRSHRGSFSRRSLARGHACAGKPPSLQRGSRASLEPSGETQTAPLTCPPPPAQCSIKTPGSPPQLGLAVS